MRWKLLLGKRPQTVKHVDDDKERLQLRAQI